MARLSIEGIEQFSFKCRHLNKKTWFGICIFLLFLLIQSGIVPHAVEAVDEAHPAYVPTGITASFSGDPTTGFAVTWRTRAHMKNPIAQIALASASPSFTDMFKSVYASTTFQSDNPGEGCAYEVHFNHLSPATAYTYRVGDGTTFSEWFDIKTASETPEPFRFLYLGDEQNFIQEKCSRSIRAAFLHAPDARFICHTGDLVAEGYDEGLWRQWHHAMGFIAAICPSLPVPGNHDMHRFDSETVQSVSHQYRLQFALPMNGPSNIEALSEESYYVDYQEVRIISLDSNVYANDDYEVTGRAEIAEAQTKWLEKVLENNPCGWTIVMHHHPIFSVGKDRDYAELRDILMPIYDRFKVDLVLQGHDHHYGRTHKISGGKIVPADQPGTVYAVSVSGPKMYSFNPKFTHLMAKTLGDRQMYQVITVSERLLLYQAFSIDGALRDQFELRKTGRDETSLLE